MEIYTVRRAVLGPGLLRRINRTSFFLGWAGHQHGLYKMQKQNCQSINTTLDTTAENRLLTNQYNLGYYS